MHKLHELKQTIIGHLEEYADSGIKSFDDLKEIDTLAHAAKNLSKVIEACEEDEGGSSFRRGRVYEDRPRAGGYVDGAYRRDRISRYAREGRGGTSYEDGYAEASNEMLNMLDTMLRDAKDDRERKTIREMMDSLKVRG